MANKKVVPNSGSNASKTGVNPVEKKNTKNSIPEKVEEKTQKKSQKKSSALLAASKGRSAVDAVNATSSRDVRGNSGLANTGTIISYD